MRILEQKKQFVFICLFFLLAWQHSFADNHTTQPRHLPNESLPVFNHWLAYFSSG